MGLSSLFHFFGSKWRIAPHYPRPKHDILIEPFAGAAGYALLHYERQVKLYDANPVIVGVWEFLIKSSPEDILKLPLDFDDLDVDCPELSQEAKWFIGFWINGATARPATRWSSWARNAHKTKSLYWGPVARQLVANAVPKIKHWTVGKVLNYDQVPNEVATWFIDPPYHLGGRSYVRQVHSYAHLGEWCQTRLGQVIACEQQGATWLPFEPLGRFKGAPGAAKSRGQYTEEVIWHRA
jgi:hypothetical protein